MKKLVMGTTALALLASFNASAQEPNRPIEDSAVSSKAVKAKEGTTRLRRSSRDVVTEEGTVVETDGSVARKILGNVKELLKGERVDLTLEEVQARVASATVEAMEVRGKDGQVESVRILDALSNPEGFAGASAADTFGTLDMAQAYGTALVVGGGRLAFGQGEEFRLPDPVEVSSMIKNWNPRARGLMARALRAAAVELARDPSLKGYEAFRKAVARLSKEYAGFEDAFRANCGKPGSYIN